MFLMIALPYGFLACPFGEELEGVEEETVQQISWWTMDGELAACGGTMTISLKPGVPLVWADSGCSALPIKISLFILREEQAHFMMKSSAGRHARMTSFIIDIGEEIMIGSEPDHNYSSAEEFWPHFEKYSAKCSNRYIHLKLLEISGIKATCVLSLPDTL